MSGELTQYQHDVDRTLDEMEGQITDAQNQVGVLGLQRLWQSNASAATFTETCGSIMQWRSLATVQFMVNNDMPLITGSINLLRNNAFSAAYMIVTDPDMVGVTVFGPNFAYILVPGSETSYDLAANRIDTHNHSTGTTWSMLSCSKSIAFQLPNGAYAVTLWVHTDDTGPVGSDCSLVVNSASIKVRSI